VPPAIAESLREMGRVINPPETAKLYLPLAQTEPYADVQVERDLHYGPAERNLLDVFAPASPGGARPVLVFVHGGAFTGGNKRGPGGQYYDNIMLWATRSGYVGVNMTYRLAPQYVWPVAQLDIAAALSWVRQNIAARGGNPARIVLMGHSAGAAHVAQYLGHPQFHIAPGSGLVGAIMVSGLFDPTTAEANPPLRAYFGTDPARYAERSALPGMAKTRLPMLLVVAELDPPYFHAQAEQARASLCQSGACPQTVKLLGHNHMSEVFAINTNDQVLTGALRAFINAR